jgi:hypothetical protein
MIEFKSLMQVGGDAIEGLGIAVVIIGALYASGLLFSALAAEGDDIPERPGRVWKNDIWIQETPISQRHEIQNIFVGYAASSSYMKILYRDGFPEGPRSICIFLTLATMIIEDLAYRESF